MVTTTGSLGDSVKPLFGAKKMAKDKMKSGGGKKVKSGKQTGAAAGVDKTQSKGSRLDSLKGK